MNKLYAAVIIVGFINLAILIVGIVIVHEFKDFKDLCNMWRSMKKADQDLYKLIIERYKIMEESFERHCHIFELMAKQFEAMNNQYKMISKSQDEYRQLCKECIDRQSDTYEQFKLCNDRLNEIFTPKESLKNDFFYDITPTNDNPNGGFHDD